MADSDHTPTLPTPSKLAAARLHLSRAPVTVRIGARSFPFTSYADVSAAYCKARDAIGATASGATGPLAPKCDLLDGAGNVVGIVAYNGNVWTDEDHWRCLYRAEPGNQWMTCGALEVMQ
jgi:hypothetical protein